MALADFIQSLQSQDTVYSTPPEPSLRVIPPEKDDSYLKVIPPDGPVTGKVDIKNKPQLKDKSVTATNTTTTINMNSDSAEVAAPRKRTIKLKLKQKPIPVVEEPKPTTNTSDSENRKVEPIVESVSKPEVEDIEEKPKEFTDEDIFNSTGTEYSKKSIWMEYYYKAKNSRKSNQIVTRMKAGRFTITPDNQVLLLPDYDIVGKDPDDVLKDKWF